MTSTPPSTDLTSLDVLAADACEVTDLAAGSSGTFALIAQGAGDGATTLLRLPLAGTPEPIEAPPIGSAVHEYGLNALAPMGSCVAALVKPGSAVAWLQSGEMRSRTAPPEVGRLGDPVWAPSADALIVASEQPRGEGFPSAALIALSAAGASRTLWAGSDFVTRPAVSPSGRLAFMTWDLPWMPWERSHIRHGRLSSDATLTELVRVRTPEGSAVAQPRFGPDGQLYFLCDATGYFELWTCEGDAVRPVTALGADIGLSLSRQTSRSYDFTASGAVLAVVWRRGASELVEIEPATGATHRIETPEPPADLVAASSGAAWYVTQPAEGPVSIRRIDSGGDQACWTAPVAGHAAPGPAPERLHAVTADGTGIDAFLFRAAASVRKGLTVLNLHGGPKSLAPQRLKGPLRALRDAGYDVVELNYRGSAGYGRAFRDRLDGAWGVADVEDVLAIERRLEALGLADRRRIVLRGGSAGGFTALNVVAREAGFAGAISYYGVSDLRRLGEATHKFESGYLKTLVGASDLADPVFAARSPITHAARIRAPVLLLQGADDKVNPPEQSLELARRITDAGGRCEVHLFADEAHGFKRLDTLRACLELEQRFLDALA